VEKSMVAKGKLTKRYDSLFLLVLGNYFLAMSSISWLKNGLTLDLTKFCLAQGFLGRGLYWLAGSNIYPCEWKIFSLVRRLLLILLVEILSPFSMDLSYFWAFIFLFFSSGLKTFDFGDIWVRGYGG